MLQINGNWASELAFSYAGLVASKILPLRIGAIQASVFDLCHMNIVKQPK